MSDWKTRAKAQYQAIDDLPDWKRRAMAETRLAGPDEWNIDKEADDAPPLVRMEVGALTKPEDRLAALQKHYPDAKNYGSDNFIFTDPDTGRTRLYNHESWFPSLGDIASISPEIGETVGGVVGGVGGATLGSVVPGPGSVLGGISGAGTGATVGREVTARGLNYIFGNEDTRTGGEQVKDAALTFALGAGGEGVGRAAGTAFKAGQKAWNRHVIGAVDDSGLVAERMADYDAIGIEPTYGLASGNSKSALLEQALAPTRQGHEITRRIEDAFTKQGDEFTRIVDGMSDRPLTIAEAGEALQRQAQAAKEAGLANSERLYDEVGAKVTSPAVVDSTGNFLKGLATERAGYGEFDTLTKGAQTDRVIQQTTAILADAKKGMSFDQLKAARSYVGQAAADETDKVLKNHLNGLYASLTSDMEKTAAASGDDALNAFRTANDDYRQFVSEDGFGRGSVADTVMKKNADDVLSWAIQGKKNGGDRIAAVRRTVMKADGGADSWGQVTAGVIDRLGRGSDDAFDPGKFMRDWRAISPEAKNAMFNGTAQQQYKNDLDRLARIADNYTKYRKHNNHSNTESARAIKDSLNPMSKDNAIATLVGASMTGEPMTGLAIGAAKGSVVHAGNWASRRSRAKLMTSPEVVNVMANLPSAEMKKGGIAGAFQQLKTIAGRTKDQALAAAINDYLRDTGAYAERNENNR